jgi:hypothetical protein
MKVNGIAYYQIDNESMALHEVELELRNAGMKNIKLEVLKAEETEDVPDDWFEDYTFEIEFSGEIDCSAEEFDKKIASFGEVYFDKED